MSYLVGRTNQDYAYQQKIKFYTTEWRLVLWVGPMTRLKPIGASMLENNFNFTLINRFLEFQRIVLSKE